MGNPEAWIETVSPMNNRPTAVAAGKSWFADAGPGRIDFDIRPIRYAERRHETAAWGGSSVAYGQSDTQWLKKLNNPAFALSRRSRRLRRREWD